MTGRVPDDGREYRATTHDVDTRLETVVRRGRQGVGGWWWPALLAVPLVLAGLSSLFTHGRVETDLAKKSSEALAGAGITASQVDFSGRDGTVTLGSGEAATAKSLIEKVNGVRVVNVSGGSAAAPSASASPSQTPIEASTAASPSASETGSASGSMGDFTIDTSADGKSVTVKAVVPDEAAKTALLAAVKAANPGVTVDDQISIEAGSMALPTAGITALLTGLKDIPGVSVSGVGDAITLTGEVASEAIKTTIGDAAAQLNPMAKIDNQLTVAAGGSTVSADCAAVNTEVAAQLKATPLQFAVNSANLLPKSVTDLNAIAAKLKDCLGADGGAKGLTIAGYTDSDGGDAANKALSQRRADAVKATLVKAGLPGDKVTSTGYGEANPIADNNTAAGKAKNRRVEITLV